MTARSHPGVAEGALLALVGCGLAAAVAVWLWGGLAGALFGGGWPSRSGPAQVLAVLARLPSHLADPAAAWPRQAQTQLPDTTGMYGALAVVLTVAVGL